MVDKVNKYKLMMSVSSNILSKLGQMINTPSGKATLANLRSSIGKPLSESLEIWPLVFEFLPDDFLNDRGSLSKEELAILSTLQLYALHQQGKSESVHHYNEERSMNLGYSLNSLRTKDSSRSIDQRFNALITSTTYEELMHHLRQMIKILKAKSESRVDYARLSVDLYSYLNGNQESIRLRWARAYYRIYSNKGENNNDNK